MSTSARVSTAVRTRPDAAEPAKALVALFQAAEHVKTLVARVVEPHGITGQQYNVLRILRGAGPGGLPTLTVAERMIERAPGITRMMDRLEAKGLVVRERSADDRRSVECRVTNKGLDLLQQLDQPVNEVDRATFSALGANELVQLRRLLDRIRLGSGDSGSRGASTISPGPSASP